MAKVLEIAKFYPPEYGGMETVVQSLSEGISKNHKVFVLAATRNKNLPEAENPHVNLCIERVYCPVLFFSQPIGFFWKRLYNLYKMCDVIHLHSPNPLLELMVCILHMFKPKKIIVTYHSPVVSQKWIQRLYFPIQKRVMKIAKSITFASKVLENLEFSKNCNDSHVIPFALSNYRFKEKKNSIDSFKKKEEYAIFVGRLVNYKGLPVLLHAWRNQTRNLKIIGSGPQLIALKRIVNQLDLNERVEFLGHVSESSKFNWIKGAEFLVLPSLTRAESFGISLLEAMSLGVPVISTELGTATSEINIHGLTGMVVPPNNVAELESAISELFSNKTELNEMGKAAKMQIQSHYQYEHMISRYLEILM